MTLPAKRPFTRLPKRLPAGTVYVVEGRGGQYGHLQVSSRYVVMPGGQRLEIPADFSRTGPALARQREHVRRHAGRRAATRSNPFGAPTKKSRSWPELTVESDVSG
jgi:hypothetical protein